MKYELKIEYDIYQIEDGNARNWFSYNDWANHVDKDKEIPYNLLVSHIYFKCQPDSKVGLTRRIVKKMLKEKDIMSFIYETVYCFIENENNDSNKHFPYPYKNEIEPIIELDSRISGNMVIFTVSAKNINNRKDILDGLKDIMNKEGS